MVWVRREREECIGRVRAAGLLDVTGGWCCAGSVPLRSRMPRAKCTVLTRLPPLSWVFLGKLLSFICKVKFWNLFLCGTRRV